jgi:hypothetical protein
MISDVDPFRGKCVDIIRSAAIQLYACDAGAPSSRHVLSDGNPGTNET